MSSKKGGQPPRRRFSPTWSDPLWESYVRHGEGDQKYVESCNRFLEQMVRSDLCTQDGVGIMHITLNLITKLQVVLVGVGSIPPFPSHFDIRSGLPHLAKIQSDEGQTIFDVYQTWWDENILWPQECQCGVKNTIRPWFLRACTELVGRSLQGDLFLGVDVYATGGPYEVDEPIPEDAELTMRPSEDMERSLSNNLWRIDEKTLERVDLTLERKPTERRVDFINRAKLTLDAELIKKMKLARDAAPHPKVALQGRPVDPSSRHEEMLVRRMFGQPIPEIVGACQDALLNKKGRPLSDSRKTVYDRTDLIAAHLGFLPASGEEES